MTEEADYVIVGAGSSGCIIASRLAESGASVVLLEAGARDRSRIVRTPGMMSLMHTVPQIKKKLDWGYYTVPQQHALGRQIPTTRGKVVGGSSSVNGMLFVRGHRSNYDDWAAQGCTGWSYEEVLGSFKKLEDWEGGASELRGSGGPIAVTRQKDLTSVSEAFTEAISETLDLPVNDDYNGATQEGVAPVQMSARSGKRFSSSFGYLNGAGSPNGTANPRVEVASEVSHVVFEGGRAVGVQVRDKSGPRIVRAAKEVVLSAGVVGSPQILMLSGVGPADHLREVGVDIRVDLPVGKNLHDHLFVPMTFTAPSAKHRGTAGHFLRGIISETVKGDTWFGRTVFENMAFVRTQHSSDRPDLQIHTLPWAYPAPNQDAPGRPDVDTRPSLTVMPTLIYPKSRGELRLASSDPSTSPLIDPAYLSDPDDARLLLDGIKMVRETMAGKRMSDVVTGELHPGKEYFDDAAMQRELPNRVTTVYHPVGTCRMGADEDAVVDPQLRVRGVDGLRVADASIIPSITGGNTNAPAMMIGEKCAQLMRQS